jgi:hypothetical protein
VSCRLMKGEDLEKLVIEEDLGFGFEGEMVQRVLMSDGLVCLLGLLRRWELEGD